MVSTVKSLGIVGIDGFAVTAECYLGGGTFSFDIVGLPDAAVKEARDRIRACLHACGLPFHSGHITVNLAPAHLRKEGTLYDLPILLAVLQANGFLKVLPEDAAFLGEVSLDGAIRPATGVLPMTAFAAKTGIRTVFVPAENAAEAALAKGITVIPVRGVWELLDHLEGRKLIDPCIAGETVYEVADVPDFADVRGQDFAKYCMEIAAAGGHNILMVGPPGSGKSMLASRLPGILPAMTYEEQMESTMLHSVAGLLSPLRPMITTRPFRAPHHTTSRAGLAGGGHVPRPGEISLAHNGVLFLDELPEYPVDVLEVLRQPLEERRITISRVSGTLTYPSRFMLVAAMNPCKCGWHGIDQARCRCSPSDVERYRARISGPLMDRFDLFVTLRPVTFSALHDDSREESSESVRQRVQAARDIQRRRLEGSGCLCNADIPAALLRQCIELTPDASALLESAFTRLGLTARAHDRLLRVARTIADLDGASCVGRDHLSKALQCREPAK